MRHDPASGAIVIMLRSLKMHGMAQAVADLIDQGAPAFEAATPVLSQLLKAELAEREVRSIAYHMKAARFPAYKDLSGFDFTASEVNEAAVRTLHRCEFMDGAQNVVLIGGPGTGMSIGVEPGPPIGVQKGPLCCVGWGARGRLSWSRRRSDDLPRDAVFGSGIRRGF
jgi:hypothetical protein